MTFKASLDNLAIGITLGVIILFAGIIFGQFWFITDNGYSGLLYTSAALILIILISYAFSPLGYKILNNELIINRPFTNVKIDRSNIQSVEIIDHEQLRWSIRTFGVGGLFGYYGKFANTSLGSMTWYVTRRDKIVLLKTNDNKNIILSPDDPEMFVEEYMKSVNRN